MLGEFGHVEIQASLTSSAYALLDGTPALTACRDLANSNKHFELDLKSRAYRSHPPTVDGVDYSASPTVSVTLREQEDEAATAHRRLKVGFVAGRRVRVEDVADQAISAWESFFAQHGLAP